MNIQTFTTPEKHLNDFSVLKSLKKFKKEDRQKKQCLFVNKKYCLNTTIGTTFMLLKFSLSPLYYLNIPVRGTTFLYDIPYINNKELIIVQLHSYIIKMHNHKA